MQLLISQLTGISVGALIDGEDDAKNFLEENLFSIKYVTENDKSNFSKNTSDAINNMDFYKTIIHPNIKNDLRTVLIDDAYKTLNNIKNAGLKIK